MKSQRTATILHLPLGGARCQLWEAVAEQLGDPALARRLQRRPWYWLRRVGQTGGTLTAA